MMKMKISMKTIMAMTNTDSYSEYIIDSVDDMITMENNLNAFPHKDAIKEIEKALVDELTKSINEEIILDVLSPETKGLPTPDRKKTIQRNQKIDQIIGNGSITLENGIEIDNFTGSTIDIKSHFEKKTFNLVSDLSKPGFVWVPYIVSGPIQVISDVKINPKLYSKVHINI